MNSPTSRDSLPYSPDASERLEAMFTDASWKTNLSFQRVSDQVAVWQPKSQKWWWLTCLALIPTAYRTCQAFDADWQATVGITLLPIFGFFGFCVAEFIQRTLMVRWTFDRRTGKATAGEMEIPLSEIRGIQVLEILLPSEDNEERLRIQINLVRVVRGQVSRLNLWQGVHTELRPLARELALFLGVPCCENYLSRETVLTGWKTGCAVGLLFITVGLGAIGMSLYVFDPFAILVGGIMGVGLMAMGGFGLYRLRVEYRQRSTETLAK